VIPLRDHIASSRVPYVTYAVIGTSVLVFLWQLSLGERGGQQAVYAPTWAGSSPERLSSLYSSTAGCRCSASAGNRTVDDFPDELPQNPPLDSRQAKTHQAKAP